MTRRARIAYTSGGIHREHDIDIDTAPTWVFDGLLHGSVRLVDIDPPTAAVVPDDLEDGTP